MITYLITGNKSGTGKTLVSTLLALSLSRISDENIIIIKSDPLGYEDESLKENIANHNINIIDINKKDISSTLSDLEKNMYGYVIIDVNIRECPTDFFKYVNTVIIPSNLSEMNRKIISLTYDLFKNINANKYVFGNGFVPPLKFEDTLFPEYFNDIKRYVNKDGFTLLPIFLPHTTSFINTKTGTNRYMDKLVQHINQD